MDTSLLACFGRWGKLIWAALKVGNGSGGKEGSGVGERYSSSGWGMAVVSEGHSKRQRGAKREGCIRRLTSRSKLGIEPKRFLDQT